MTADASVPHRIAKTLRGVCITVIVDFRAIDEVGFTIDSNGQVASRTGKIELALAA